MQINKQNKEKPTQSPNPVTRAGFHGWGVACNSWLGQGGRNLSVGVREGWEAGTGSSLQESGLHLRISLHTLSSPFKTCLRGVNKNEQTW